MFAVQCFRVKGGRGLGWEHERSPKAICVVKEAPIKDTQFEITIGAMRMLCALQHRVTALRRAQGVVGRIEGGMHGVWSIAIAGTSLDWKPMMSLIDQDNQIVTDIRGSQGDCKTSLGRAVFATASSNLGTKFWITGPNAVESISAILHPRRIVYGVTNRQTLFSDAALIAVLLLYDAVFTPLVPWSGCS